MKKYYLSGILLLLGLSLVMCNRREPPQSYSNYEELIHYIDTDSVNYISAIWRQIGFLVITYHYGEEYLEFYIQKKRNKPYLEYEDEKVRLDRYEKFAFKPQFDSVGIDIQKIKYVYGLMSEYPLRRVAYVRKYKVSIITADSVKLYYVRDSNYLFDRPYLENINGEWYRDIR